MPALARNAAAPCGRTPDKKRQMIRMRQVFAPTTADRDSRISDDSDERDPVFYNKQIDDSAIMRRTLRMPMSSTATSFPLALNSSGGFP